MDRIIIGIVALLTFWVVQATNRSPAIESKERFLAPPPEYIEHFHFGFADSMADSLWLRWVQDADNCQTYLKPVEDLKPDFSKFMDPMFNPRYKNCDNSWSFKMLDAVTKLAPRFKMAYWAGGISLSVMTEDYEGASKIFNRGMEVYPKDWILAYRAAYHFMLGVNDKKRAAEALIIAGDNGAPYWVKLLASRMYSQAGQAELGISVLESYKKTLTDPKQIEFIDNRIEQIKRSAK